MPCAVLQAIRQSGTLSEEEVKPNKLWSWRTLYRSRPDKSRDMQFLLTFSFMISAVSVSVGVVAYGAGGIIRLSWERALTRDGCFSSGEVVKDDK